MQILHRANVCFSEHEYFETKLAGRVLNELQTLWIVKINSISNKFNIKIWTMYTSNSNKAIACQLSESGQVTFSNFPEIFLCH